MAFGNDFTWQWKLCCPRWRLTSFLQGPHDSQSACFEYLALYILRTQLSSTFPFSDLHGGTKKVDVMSMSLRNQTENNK
jgi:hypothetical protein